MNRSYTQEQKGLKANYVETPDKSRDKRKQKIHISYDLIGFIPVDVRTKAEQA